MTLLHTEYYCDDCRCTYRKLDAQEHKYSTGHSITKKIIYPSENFDDAPSLVVEPSKPIERAYPIDWCVDCVKEVVAPMLHKTRGHMVFKTKASV